MPVGLKCWDCKCVAIGFGFELREENNKTPNVPELSPQLCSLPFEIDIDVEQTIVL